MKVFNKILTVILIIWCLVGAFLLFRTLLSKTKKYLTKPVYSLKLHNNNMSSVLAILGKAKKEYYKSNEEEKVKIASYVLHLTYKYPRNLFPFEDVKFLEHIEEDYPDISNFLNKEVSYK